MSHLYTYVLLARVVAMIIWLKCIKRDLSFSQTTSIKRSNNFGSNLSISWFHLIDCATAFDIRSNILDSSVSLCHEKCTGERNDFFHSLCLMFIYFSFGCFISEAVFNWYSSLFGVTTCQSSVVNKRTCSLPWRVPIVINSAQIQRWWLWRKTDLLSKLKRNQLRPKKNVSTFSRTIINT